MYAILLNKFWNQFTVTNTLSNAKKTLISNSKALKNTMAMVRLKNQHGRNLSRRCTTPVTLPSSSRNCKIWSKPRKKQKKTSSVRIFSPEVIIKEAMAVQISTSLSAVNNLYASWAENKRMPKGSRSRLRAVFATASFQILFLSINFANMRDSCKNSRNSSRRLIRKH